MADLFVQFQILKLKWESETAHLSSITEISMHPAPANYWDGASCYTINPFRNEKKAGSLVLGFKVYNRRISGLARAQRQIKTDDRRLALLG